MMWIKSFDDLCNIAKTDCQDKCLEALSVAMTVKLAFYSAFPMFAPDEFTRNLRYNRVLLDEDYNVLGAMEYEILSLNRQMCCIVHYIKMYENASLDYKAVEDELQNLGIPVTIFIDTDKEYKLFKGNFCSDFIILRRD